MHRLFFNKTYSNKPMWEIYKTEIKNANSWVKKKIRIREVRLTEPVEFNFKKQEKKKYSL